VIKNLQLIHIAQVKRNGTAVKLVTTKNLVFACYP
jgi:hypothetical protein